MDSSANPDNPIRHYFFTGFKSTNWNDITSQEAGKFLFHYSKLLRAFKPDIVIGFGCDALCRSMWMEARLFGIPTAYIICNGNHQNYRFPLHDILLCDSEATSRFYKEKEGLTVHPMGNFINPKLIIAQNRSPQAVTLINPCFAKGVAVAARLILMANKERPDIPFLIVETRQKLAEALKLLKNREANPVPLLDVRLSAISRFDRRRTKSKTYTNSRACCLRPRFGTKVGGAWPPRLL